MVKDYAKICDSIYNIAKGQATAAESKLLFGEVKSVNPLEIKLVEHDDIILDSESVYLTDNVIVKKVRMSIHRIYGEPEEIQFRGNANDIINSINMLLYNESQNANNINKSKSGTSYNMGLSFDNYINSVNGSTGSLVASENTGAPGDVAVSGAPFSVDLTANSGSKSVNIQNPSANITIDDPAKSIVVDDMSFTQLMNLFEIVADIQQNVKFHIEFIEKEENKPELDEPEQKMTVRIEGVLHEGLKIGDYCLLSSHNHGQKYLVHRVINRHRETDRDRMEQYEQSYLWDSRINDVGINESDLG